MKRVAMKGSAMKKAMKAKKVSVIAKGKMAKPSVLSGRKAKTQGGLTKDKLVKNKAGRVVSKAMSARAKKARKELGLTGFVAIGGKSAAGKALYAKAKSIL